MISVLVLLFKFWLGRPSLSWNSWKLTKAKQTWDFILFDCFQRYQTGDELKPSIQSIKSSKSTKKSKKQIPLKNICAWEENFNSVFLVQRVGVETADHLCFRTSAWTDCHSLFQRGAWFTPRQKWKLLIKFEEEVKLGSFQDWAQTMKELISSGLMSEGKAQQSYITLSFQKANEKKNSEKTNLS